MSTFRHQKMLTRRSHLPPLVVEPISWPAAGGSPIEYLATAGGADLAVVALRLARLGAVLGALVLMFRPSANAFFRGGQSSGER